MTTPKTWLERYFRSHVIKVDGEEPPLRSAINFVGATAEDDPDNDTTNIVTGGGSGLTGDTDTWAPIGANTWLQSKVFPFTHDGDPDEQEGMRLEIPDGYTTQHEIVVQCAGPGAESFRLKLQGMWVRDGDLVRVVDDPNDSNAASNNAAGFGAVLTLDGTDAVVTCTQPVTGDGEWSIVITRVRTRNGTAPVVLSVTPSVGDTAGNEPITIDGARFDADAEVEIDGNPADNVVVVDSNTIECDTPAGSAGAKDVVVTNVGAGKSGTLANGFTYAATFDPLSLGPVWRHKNYAGTTFVDDSGNGNNLSGGSPPPVGSALNGHASADFTPTQFFSSASNSNTLLGAGGWSYVALLYSDAVPAASGVDYQDGNILSDAGNGEFTIGHIDESGTPKLVACVYSGAFKRIEIPASVGSHHLLQVRGDNVNAEIRVGGGAWQSLPCGALSFLVPSPLRMGHSYAGSTQFDGRVWEDALFDYALSDAELNNYRAYCLSEYGVSV